MKLDKATEVLEDIRKDGTDPGYPIDDNALKLGIEALKAIPRYRRIVYPDQRFLLPGETEE